MYQQSYTYPYPPTFSASPACRWAWSSGRVGKVEVGHISSCFMSFFALVEGFTGLFFAEYLCFWGITPRTPPFGLGTSRYSRQKLVPAFFLIRHNTALILCFLHNLYESVTLSGNRQ